MKSTVADGTPESNERLAALRTNIEAAAVVADAVRGTLGPKGLDVLLMDGSGGVIITNDGATILQNMDIAHPVARLMIRLAQSQDEEVGDGTTTATIMAGALVRAGAAQIERGVPVNRILEGMELSWTWALRELEKQARPLSGPDDPLLGQVAVVAARGQEEIARMAVKAAQLVGKKPLTDGSCILMERVTGELSGVEEAIPGIVVKRGRTQRVGQAVVNGAGIFIFDDELAPEDIEDKALGTEAGFAEYLSRQERFRENLRKLSDAGGDVVLLNRGVDDAAQEILADLGMMVIERVPHRILEEIARHTGGRLLSRGVLERSCNELRALLGQAAQVKVDDEAQTVRIVGGKGEPTVTITVTAATREVLDERWRIARDAVGSVQAAVRAGVVAGGGAVEIALSRFLQRQRTSVSPLQAYGLDCCVEALRQPLAQIAENAGFNRLEKVEEVLAAQEASESSSLGIDCETGEVRDLAAAGIWDPFLVKAHAMRAAFEIARAVLRINLVLRKRIGEPAQLD